MSGYNVQWNKSGRALVEQKTAVTDAPDENNLKGSSQDVRQEVKKQDYVKPDEVLIASTDKAVVLSKKQYHRITNPLISRKSSVGGTGSNEWKKKAHSPDYYEKQSENNSAAVASMILGIMSIAASFIAVGFLLGIPAIICGAVALNKLNESGNSERGKGMATAGLICGVIGVILSFIVLMAILGDLGGLFFI